MKYSLDVEKYEGVTHVNLRVESMIRRFTCADGEAIHFTVVNGELIFSGHTVKPPSGMFGPGSIIG